MRIKYVQVLVPPGIKELNLFLQLLNRGSLMETAAACAFGWRVSMLRNALIRGRAGQPGFRELVEQMDAVTFQQSDDFWGNIMERIREGDTAAALYFHQRRLAPREKIVQDQILSDELTPEVRADEFTDEDILLAEGRVMAALAKDSEH